MNYKEYVFCCRVKYKDLYKSKILYKAIFRIVCFRGGEKVKEMEIENKLLLNKKEDSLAVTYYLNAEFADIVFYCGCPKKRTLFRKYLQVEHDLDRAKSSDLISESLF